MLTENNKVKFGLKNVHYAKITGWSEDGTTPTYATPVRIPGAVNLSVDPNGEIEPFYADNIVYYQSSNNAGYSGSLEIALIPTSFAVDILKEKQDNNGVIVEDANAEPEQFALLFQFEGDKTDTRHVLYCCTASRPSVAGQTKEATKTPQTDTLNLESVPLPNGNVKARTDANTTAATKAAWYESVYMPDFTGD